VTIRTKVIFFSLLHLVAGAGVGVYCLTNIQREEDAFNQSRRALNTHAAVTDIEYFLGRQGRALANFVLLGDEAEKMQLSQAQNRCRQRVEAWQKAVLEGNAVGEEIRIVQGLLKRVAVESKAILDGMENGRRVEAMEAVDKTFGPVFDRALKDFHAVKERTEEAKAATETAMLENLRRNHMSLLGGLAVPAFLGLGFLLWQYRATIGPVNAMRRWAERMARGERNVPLGFRGQSELMDLAQSIGEMAIQLMRPRSLPIEKPPTPAAGPPEVGAVVSVVAPAPAESKPAAAVAPPPKAEAVKAPPAAAPSGPKDKDNFEEAVDEFRDVLAQLAGQHPSKSRKLG